MISELNNAPTIDGNLAGQQSRRKYSARSTATAAQIQRALELLRVHARHTYEFRALGISHPAARIKDLIALGYDIQSSRIVTVDSEAYLHRNVALYCLLSEPESKVVA